MSPRYNSRQYLPRKGTETHSHNDATLVDDDIDSRQYLPRKGTETALNLNFACPITSIIPDNIYPARGRKPTNVRCHHHQTKCYSRQYLPRKGTETQSTKDNARIYQLIPNSRQYLPRKGTETELLPFCADCHF